MNTKSKTKTNIINRLFSLCLFFISLIVAGNGFSTTIIESNIPDIGQRSAMLLSSDTEEFLGFGLIQQLNGGDVIVKDRIVNEYLETISQRLFKAVQQLNYKLDYKLDIFGVHSKELNAFAFFGGHIAVHNGLILSLHSESELAAVLAHETAHIAQRHLARIFTTNKKMLPLTYAELLAAMVIGALGAPEAGSHLATAIMGSHVQRLINYTREHEQEADRIGIQILSKAGFDPNAFPGVFRTLNESTRYHHKPPEYLLTHPVFEARIADCTDRAQHMPYQQVADNLFFHLIRARVEIALENNPKQHLKKIEERLLKDSSNKIANEYCYGMALIINKQYELGLSKLQALKMAHPEIWLFDFTVAEGYLEANKPIEAISILKPLHELYPTHGSIVLTYADALLKTKQAKECERILLKYKKQHSNDPEVLQRLVQTYSLLKNSLALHQMQAEWHFTRGEYKEASQQLDIALEDTSSGTRTANEIKKRKEELESIMAAQKKIKM